MNERFFRVGAGELKFGTSEWRKGNQPIEAAPIQRDTSVPLEVAAEAHKQYCNEYGSAQTLQRINERGGFGAAELALLLYARIKKLEHRIYQLRGQHRG